MRVAVVGSRGQLGAAVVHECSTAHQVVALTRQDLDVTDDGAVGTTLGRIKPDAIINCAGFNDVDGSEDRPVQALNANAFAVRALAQAAADQGATFVHYSSDFVFDGTKSTPYTEDDRPNPRGVYAVSKLLGEWFAADAPRAFVLRVESLFGRASGGPPSRGSVAAILNTLMAGGSPKVFIDRTVSPTYAIDAAHATRLLMESTAPAGLYHCVNSGSCTWLEFARELARQFGIEATMTPVQMNEIAFRASRPQYCALSNEKLRAVGIEMPSWQDALRRLADASGQVRR